MPVRSIPRNYRSLTGKVNNAHNQVAVAFESTLERDFFLILDFDSTVAAFEEQPVCIGYEHPTGTRRTYNEARVALLNRARFRAEHCPASPWDFLRSGRATHRQRAPGI